MPLLPTTSAVLMALCTAGMLCVPVRLCCCLASVGESWQRLQQSDQDCLFGLAYERGLYAHHAVLCYAEGQGWRL